MLLLVPLDELHNFIFIKFRAKNEKCTEPTMEEGEICLYTDILQY